MDFGIGILKKIVKKMINMLFSFFSTLCNIVFGDRLPYYCPCCNTYLLKFKDGGYMRRPNKFNPKRYEGLDQKVICPVCNSLPRHRILSLWMQENKHLLENRKILYFAQEKSIKRWCKKNHIECTSADLYAKADINIDIEDTGLADSSYDMVFCNHVLEHVQDYKRALKELYRIIDPKGIIVLSFPVDTKLETVYEDNSIVTEEDRVKHFGQYDHRRVFGRDLRKILEIINAFC